MAEKVVPCWSLQFNPCDSDSPFILKTLYSSLTIQIRNIMTHVSFLS